MSFSMYWRPVPRDLPPAEWVPDPTRYALVDPLWGDEPLRRDKATVDIDDQRTVGYMEGLAATGVEGAAELLAALRTHRRIVIWIGEADDHDG